MGKIYDDEKNAPAARQGSAIFDPSQADGRPRHMINMPEVVAEMRAVLDKYWPIGAKGAVARGVQDVVSVKEAAPLDVRITMSQARNLLIEAIREAGGQRALAAKSGLNHTVLSKAANGRRELPLSVLTVLGLTPAQIILEE